MKIASVRPWLIYSNAAYNIGRKSEYILEDNEKK